MKTIAKKEVLPPAVNAKVQSWYTVRKDHKGNTDFNFHEMLDFAKMIYRLKPENSKTFTLDQLEQACREAWNAGRFAMSAYMQDQQYICLEAWMKQYKSKLEGGE